MTDRVTETIEVLRFYTNVCLMDDRPEAAKLATKAANLLEDLQERERRRQTTFFQGRSLDELSADLAELAEWRAGRRTAWQDGEPADGSDVIVLYREPTCVSKEVSRVSFYPFVDNHEGQGYGTIHRESVTHHLPFNPPEEGR